jgi:type I restriction enzyme, S subunit
MSNKDLTTVKLGDIAENISIRIDDPSKSGFDRFVGLEHLNGGSVTVSNWGSTESLTSTMKQFQSGDVLLARRNAHLRRASVVDFEGVCSGDAYVLREKPDSNIQGLLKYILNTKRFWEYAIANADGSMSTRVKWKHLKHYSFEMKTNPESQDILKLLSASTNLCTVLNSTSTQSFDLFEVIRRKILAQYGTKKVRISELLECNYGKPLPAKKRSGAGFPVVSSSGVCGMHNEKNVEKSGIIVGRKGSAGLVHWVEGPHFVIDTAYSVSIKDGNDPRFVYHLLQTIDIKRLVITTTIPGLNRNDLLNQFVNIPDEKEQVIVSKFLDQLEQMVSDIKLRKEDANLLQLRLIEESLR